MVMQQVWIKERKKRIDSYTIVYYIMHQLIKVTGGTKTRDEEASVGFDDKRLQVIHDCENNIS